MPGAFDYLDPTAPKPNPDDIWDWNPRAQPYAHVPTTGEVRNLDQPTDTFRDRVAQGVFDASPLALGPAAYSAANNLATGVRDQDLGTGALGAFEAMFLGLPAVRNLTKAGKITPGGRGSEEMLSRAQGAWKEGADPRKVWDETGWASGQEFGPRFDKKPPEPVMWHGMPDLDLSTYNPGVHKGTIGSLGSGVDDAFIASPELKDLPATIELGAKIPQRSWGGTMNYSQWAGRPTGWQSMRVTAPNDEAGRAIFAHELQHGLHGTKDIDFEPTGRYRTPNDVTRRLEEMAQEAGKKQSALWEELQGLPQGDPRKEALLKDSARESFNQSSWMLNSGDAGEYATYANMPHEIKARMAADVYSRPRAEIEAGVYPGDIDPFSADAFYPFKAEDNGMLGPLGMPWGGYASDFFKRLKKE